MKKIIALILVVAAALQVAATDRFYIENFSINPGETKTVSIMLDNEVSYTAFQANLFLPVGLSVVQEDGYYLIDLTERKGRDHTISSKQNPDGSIFIMSYSMGVKAYSGNNGALVTMTIAADDGFTAPASISLRNILFTTQNGEEVAFADETCNVSFPVTVVPGDVNGDGNITITDVTVLIDYLLSETSPINSANADVNGDARINITDVTSLIDILLSRP